MYKLCRKVLHNIECYYEHYGITVDREIFAVKNFSPIKINMRNILCNVRRPIYLFWSLKSGDEI